MLDRLPPTKRTGPRLTGAPGEKEYLLSPPLPQDVADKVALALPRHARSIARLWDTDTNTSRFKAHRLEAHHLRNAIRAAGENA